MNDVVKHLRSSNYASIKHVASVQACIPDMIVYVDVMIDNADVYYGSIGTVFRTSSSGFVSASDDIDNIDRAAIICVEIIEKLK